MSDVLTQTKAGRVLSISWRRNSDHSNCGLQHISYITLNFQGKLGSKPLKEEIDEIFGIVAECIRAETRTAVIINSPINRNGDAFDESTGGYITDLFAHWLTGRMDQGAIEASPLITNPGHSGSFSIVSFYRIWIWAPGGQMLDYDDGGLYGTRTKHEEIIKFYEQVGAELEANPLNRTAKSNYFKVARLDLTTHTWRDYILSLFNGPQSFFKRFRK